MIQYLKGLLRFKYEILHKRKMKYELLVNSVTSLKLYFNLFSSFYIDFIRYILLKYLFRNCFMVLMCIFSDKFNSCFAIRIKLLKNHMLRGNIANKNFRYQIVIGNKSWGLFVSFLHSYEVDFSIIIYYKSYCFPLFCIKVVFYCVRY